MFGNRLKPVGNRTHQLNKAKYDADKFVSTSIQSVEMKTRRRFFQVSVGWVYRYGSRRIAHFHIACLRFVFFSATVLQKSNQTEKQTNSTTSFTFWISKIYISSKFKMIIPVTLLLAFVSSVSGNCDNNCSGHGTCMTDDVCSCYDNWGIGLAHDSGDCSDRICPFELAWVDTPDKKGAFHKYAECAGRGICNRDVGECTCFDGYEGKACQRTTCPNDCSGHGTCEYIEDMSFAATWNDYSVHYFEDDSKTFAYTQWDNRKIRGCVCDATYGDVDCSKRLCPYGTDVLDVRDDLLVSTKYQVQELKFKASDMLSTLQKKTFALTFKSRLNETFTTIPIAFDENDLPDLVHDIQLALLNLPNRVIDGITVAAATSYANGYVKVNITFTGPSVQGPQHMIIVEDYECGAGCTPKIDGLNLETRHLRSPSNATEIRLADYNSYECGRRGKCDYTSGLCSCFTGYTGDNCNTLTTLS